jgi:uncharacterized protein (TIGR00299 family) protein
MSRRLLWCNPSLGVAGDMWMASLLAAGADESFVRDQLATLPVPGWSLGIEVTTRRGLVATRVVVEAPDHDHHRPWSTIDAMLRDAPLDPRVAAGARRTFRALGEAEATVHGIELDQVHFHEVGAVDAIVDIVGCWAALVALDIDEVHSDAIGLGSGTARMAHGIVPVPAPAVLDLVEGVPTVPVDAAAETATPTGVALLVTMVDTWGPPPAGTVLATGRGAGTWDPTTHPNVVTAVVLDGAASPATVTATVLETNLDDVTPEVLGHVVQRLLDEGADDAWVTPIVMKKGRPGHQLSVLCRPELAQALRGVIVAETGTLGVRERPVTKHELPRTTEEVQVEGHTIRIKVGPHGAKPEHDDVATAARQLGLPLREVSARALTSRERSDG